MKKLINWYNRVENTWKILISAFSVSIVFYGSAFLSFHISQTQDLDNIYQVVLHSVVFILLFTIVSFIIRLFRFYEQEMQREIEMQKETLYQSYVLCDRIETHIQEQLDNEIHNIDKHQDILISSVKCIEKIVELVYQTFENTYGKSFDNNSRINFEVTFMTMSYKDGNITIPAAANKDGRMPRSMILREENPDIYENTVTAGIYREKGPSMRIVESTLDKGTNYFELYAGQKERIKSSIIYPVLSHKNVLLGTLVVHCDKEYFFQNNKEKYWTYLFEIFAKRIATIKLKLDSIQELLNSGPNDFKLKAIDI